MKNAQDYYLSGNADPDVIEDLTHFTAGINAYITQTPASQYSPGL
jgi:acyl-homoserine lactone acylase PvdQ